MVERIKAWLRWLNRWATYDGEVSDYFRETNPGAWHRKPEDGP